MESLTSTGVYPDSGQRKHFKLSKEYCCCVAILWDDPFQQQHQDFHQLGKFKKILLYR